MENTIKIVETFSIATISISEKPPDQSYLEDDRFDVFIGQRALLHERLLAVDVYDDEETVSRLLLGLSAIPV